MNSTQICKARWVSRSANWQTCSSISKAVIYCQSSEQQLPHKLRNPPQKHIFRPHLRLCLSDEKRPPKRSCIGLLAACSVSAYAIPLLVFCDRLHLPVKLLELGNWDSGHVDGHDWNSSDFRSGKNVRRTSTFSGVPYIHGLEGFVIFIFLCRSYILHF